MVERVFTPLHRGGSGEPLLLLHGFTDTWRSWELVLPALEQRHEVLAPTLLGHAGGPRLEGDSISDAALVDAVEVAMDEAGFETAHIAGNSLGGYLSLLLAARGRARSVVALAPAGGWLPGDVEIPRTLDYFTEMQGLLKTAAAHADAIVATPEGRRRASEFMVTNFEHIPPELLAHQMVGAAACDAVFPLIEYAREYGWNLDAAAIECPVRIVWGSADRLLVLPAAIRRYREEWLPNADYVELEGIGHCPQLDVPAETAELILGFTG